MKNQNEILGLKNIITEINIIDGRNSRKEDREERISKLREGIEIIQYEQQRENRLKQKMNTVSGTHGTITKDLTFLPSEFQERRKRVRLKKNLK